MLQWSRIELAGMPPNTSSSISCKYDVKKQGLLTVLLTTNIDLTRWRQRKGYNMYY